MGVPKPMARIILEEHKHRPITGQLCLCGRQTMALKPEEAVAFIERQGVPVRQGVKPQTDTATTAKGSNRLADTSFFDLFTEVAFNAVDITDYEEANIIHDMAQPIGAEHVDRFDFMYNGSCMDNMSNPGQFLVNTSKMLRPGGRIIHLEHGTPVSGAYIMYSPDFFFDFYAVNRYDDCKVYTALFEGDVSEGPWNLFQWDPLFIKDGYANYMMSQLVSRVHTMIITVAEKGVDSTDDVFPVQSQYRPADQHQMYGESAFRFRETPRPILRSNVYQPIEP
ncbi:MAG: hypothetical protein O3A46_14280, partial [Candidatus Poribacteria bacterium]|nr:hypothetical protein [Candidatus Poribacteria bacterium]